MNERDLQYLNALRDYYAAHKVLPSYAKVGELVGLRSTSSVAALVDRLKDGGYLNSAPDRRLQPGPNFFERAIVDRVQAGQPAPANDLPIEGFNIDQYLIDQPSRTVLLEVKGESMIDKGLMPGDIVIVKKGAPAKPGDIVVAIVDNEYTVKTLAQDAQGFYLEAAHPSFKPIRQHEHLEVFGLVVGVIRKYGK
jgi:repressor LexA